MTIIKARSDVRGPIARGGTGGITTALALRQRGITALLFEHAAAFREVGTGSPLSANATRVLRKLGLGEALARVAVYPTGRAYYAWDIGEVHPPSVRHGRSRHTLSITEPVG